MDYLFKRNAPGYRGKGKAASPTQSMTSFLGSLWCSLFGGGAAPAYRNKGETSGATAPEASPCFAGLSETPQYRTPVAGDPEPEPSPCDEPAAEECPCDPPQVIPQEIHIFPGG